MTQITAVLAAAVLIRAVAAPPAMAQDAATQPMAMGGMAAADAPQVPPVTGYSAGETVFFLHTETSDPDIAKVLSEMMDSPVLLVPGLAKVPDALLASVYVFTNGVTPMGPRGPLEFQPDVFDSPPGTAGDSPLRRIVLVTWTDTSAARVLKSAGELEAAIEAGLVTTEAPGVVVKMPLLTWPGGGR